MQADSVFKLKTKVQERAPACDSILKLGVA